MNKIKITLISVLLLVLSAFIVVSVYATSSSITKISKFTAYYNTTPITLSSPLLIDSSQVLYIPLKEVMQLEGYTITWLEEEYTFKAEKGDTIFWIREGSKTVISNNNVLLMDAEFTIDNGTMYAPDSFLRKYILKSVYYDDKLDLLTLDNRIIPTGEGGGLSDEEK